MPAVGLTRMHAMASIPPTRPPRPLLDAFRVNPLTLLLIAAINTGIALVLWIDDTRPFWQPLLTVQLYGFSIAYCVNVAKPWDHEKPLRRLVAAALIGSLIGVVLVIVVKGYSPTYVRERAAFFLYNVFAAFGNGLLLAVQEIGTLALQSSVRLAPRLRCTRLKRNATCCRSRRSKRS